MRLSSRLLVGALLAVGLVVAPSASAHSGGGHKHWKSDVPPPISAEAFLTRAAASNLFEIVTGQLAQERAASDEVKALGAEFVEHHTAALEQGRAVAAQLGIEVPEALTPKQERIVARLQQLSGERFDRKWIKVQILAHRKALALHLWAAIRGEVPEIRTLAQGALPIITQHYGQLLDLAGAYWDDGDDWQDGHHGDHGDDDDHYGDHDGDYDHHHDGDPDR